jgi:hypothetical protein
MKPVMLFPSGLMAMSQLAPPEHPSFVTGLHWTPAPASFFATSVTHDPPDGAMAGTVHSYGSLAGGYASGDSPSAESASDEGPVSDGEPESRDEPASGEKVASNETRTSGEPGPESEGVTGTEPSGPCVTGPPSSALPGDGSLPSHETSQTDASIPPAKNSQARVIMSYLPNPTVDAAPQVVERGRPS